LKNYDNPIRAVAGKLAEKPVRELQALAAALFIARKTSTGPEHESERLKDLGLCTPPLDPAIITVETRRIIETIELAAPP
jgi:hypothetical protein